jgi:hypothetical protein
VSDYLRFLEAKTSTDSPGGIKSVWVPSFLFDFQKSLVEWAVKRGRAAIFADCGMGKTPMQLVWAENVVRHTNRPVLLLAPLGVSAQTVREAAKFGIEAVRSAGGPPLKPLVVITNYEKLCHFDRADFSGVVCDESSILKNFDGKTRAAVTEFSLKLPYRLLCTATAAPNDHVELGTSSEALGGLGFQDMITRFFVQETKKDYLGWGRTKYRLKVHAEIPFWRWVCSWARACRKPSDLGFDDGKFILPELITNEYEVRSSMPADGMLFDVPAFTLPEQREEQRRTVPERCAKVAELLDHERPAIAWCHLNEEGDLLEKLIPGAVQVSGSDRDENKEEMLAAFAAGQIRAMVTKPKIGGFGMNWQHCAHQTFFPSHSFEQWYQCVRRSWRFGQTSPVTVDVIATEGGQRVLANLRRKCEAAENMFTQLVSFMNDSLNVDRSRYSGKPLEMPAWL